MNDAELLGVKCIIKSGRHSAFCLARLTVKANIILWSLLEGKILCFAQVWLTFILEQGQKRGIPLRFKVLAKVWMRKEIKLLPQQTWLPSNDKVFLNLFFFTIIGIYQSQVLLFEVTGVRRGEMDVVGRVKTLQHEGWLDSA